MIRDPLALAALIASITALSFWLDYRSRTMSKIGASMLVILFGAVLSNSGIVPHDSPAYSAIEGPVTSSACGGPHQERRLGSHCRRSSLLGARAPIAP